MTLKIQRLHDHAILPTRAHAKTAGNHSPRTATTAPYPAGALRMMKMTDLPGYYTPHCTNCYATSHSVHNCPYNNDEEGDDDAQ